MTPAEIVKALREDCKTCSENSVCRNGLNLTGLYCANKDAADLIERLEKEKAALLEKQRWTPATEPPKEWKDEKTGYMINYLINCVYSGVDVGSYHAEAGCWLCCGLPVTVTHWMPMPEAPEVE